MLTTLVISCCLVFIFLQLTNPYISLAKNAIKHTTTETYLISYRLANIHNIIKTISLAAYANAKYGLLLKVRYGFLWHFCHYGIMGDATTPIQVQKGGVPP